MFITSILAHSEEKTSIHLDKVTHVVQYNPKILEIFFVNEKSRRNRTRGNIRVNCLKDCY